MIWFMLVLYGLALLSGLNMIVRSDWRAWDKFFIGWFFAIGIISAFSRSTDVV